MKTFIRTIWLVAGAGLVMTSVVVAQSNDNVVTVDPPTIEIRAVKDHSTASATFYVTPNQRLDNIAFDASDLNDTTTSSTTQPRIPAGDIVFSTPNLQNPLPGQRHQVRVNANNITQVGKWDGEITLRWTGAFTGELGIPLTVIMATVPTLNIESPTKLVVRGTNDSTVGPRRITLHETGGGSPVTGLSLFARDLLNSDQSRALPSTAISAEFSTPDGQGVLSQIPGHGRADVVVTLNLGGAKSGHYEGQLVVQSDNAADVPIPLEVDVKDPLWWPILALVAGVLLGVGLTWYRSSVMPKDKVRVRIQELQERLKEQEFDEYCGANAKTAIRLAEDYLAQDRAKEAGDALDPAEKVWNAWSWNKGTLLVYIGDVKELREEIGKQDPELSRQLPGIAVQRDQMDTLLREQIPQYVDKPDDLWRLVFQANTGWKYVVEGALTVHSSVNKLRDKLAGDVLDADDRAQRTTELAQLAPQIRAVVAVPTVTQLDGFLDQARQLHQKLEADRQAAAQAKDGYEGCQGEADGWLRQLEPALGAGEEHIAEAAAFIRAKGLAAAEAQARTQHWKAARQLAQNGWRAAWVCNLLHRSAKNYRQDQTGGDWDGVVQAEKAAVNWLKDSTHYAQDEPTFFAALADLMDQLQAAILKASGKTFPLDWPPLPAEGDRDLLEPIRWALQPLVEWVRLGVSRAQPDAQAEPPRRWPWQAGWWTPSRRLLTANVVTFVVGVGLLSLAGYKELYADVHTFGAGGGWDYFKLFVWGFGAEAGRAQVVGLVKEWGILTPRND